MELRNVKAEIQDNKNETEYQLVIRQEAEVKLQNHLESRLSNLESQMENKVDTIQLNQSQLEQTQRRTQGEKAINDKIAQI